MMKIKSNLRISIFGKVQSGKTTLAKLLIMMLDCRLIYDIKRQYSDFGVIVRSISELHSVFSAGCDKVVYQPNDISIEHFNDVCKFIYFNVRNITFIVEEVHSFCKKLLIPEYFNKLILLCEGDPYFIGVWSISQRPANVHNDIITQSSIIVSFKLHPDDAKAVIMIPVNTILDLRQFCFAVFDDREYSENVKVYDPI